MHQTNSDTCTAFCMFSAGCLELCWPTRCLQAPVVLTGTAAVQISCVTSQPALAQTASVTPFRAGTHAPSTAAAYAHHVLSVGTVLPRWLPSQSPSCTTRTAPALQLPSAPTATAPGLGLQHSATVQLLPSPRTSQALASAQQTCARRLGFAMRPAQLQWQLTACSRFQLLRQLRGLQEASHQHRWMCAQLRDCRPAWMCQALPVALSYLKVSLAFTLLSSDCWHLLRFWVWLLLQ